VTHEDEVDGEVGTISCFVFWGYRIRLSALGLTILT